MTDAEIDLEMVARSGKWRRINNRLVNIEKVINIPRPTLDTLNFITRYWIKLPVTTEKYYRICYVIELKYHIICNIGIGKVSSHTYERVHRYSKNGKKWVKIHGDEEEEMRDEEDEMFGEFADAVVATPVSLGYADVVVAIPVSLGEYADAVVATVSLREYADMVVATPASLYN